MVRVVLVSGFVGKREGPCTLLWFQPQFKGGLISIALKLVEQVHHMVSRHKGQ